jgi:hypothetical protein
MDELIRKLKQLRVTKLVIHELDNTETQEYNISKGKRDKWNKVIGIVSGLDVDKILCYDATNALVHVYNPEKVKEEEKEKLEVEAIDGVPKKSIIELVGELVDQNLKAQELALRHNNQHTEKLVEGYQKFANAILERLTSLERQFSSILKTLQEAAATVHETEETQNAQMALGMLGQVLTGRGPTTPQLAGGNNQQTVNPMDILNQLTPEQLAEGAKLLQNMGDSKSSTDGE